MHRAAEAGITDGMHVPLGHYGGLPEMGLRNAEWRRELPERKE